MADDYYYPFPSVPPAGFQAHKRFKVTMFVPHQADVTMHVRAPSMEFVIEQVNSRRLPCAAGMQGFKVDEVDG